MDLKTIGEVFKVFDTYSCPCFELVMYNHLNVPLATKRCGLKYLVRINFRTIRIMYDFARFFIHQIVPNAFFISIMGQSMF